MVIVDAGKCSIT